ncbi:uncharacterized protein LOC105431885 [Pogonomyrmex barbatus]|uniref:Uncharacterized protein LOC105431885 n=1 Tax=Pogonomyrmex barbatus TaxID=144034 RepID=A0A6I9WNL3_9HYME|nr:uncharacterized protein LOC105431885 [Pogonomyrmex barbatus]
MRSYDDMWQVDVVEIRPYARQNKAYNYVMTVIDVLNKGKEFYNAAVKAVMNRYNIHHYSTYSVMKAAMVERINHMLKNDMWRLFTLNGSYKWLNALLRLISEYNNHALNDRNRLADITPALSRDSFP